MKNIRVNTLRLVDAADRILSAMESAEGKAAEIESLGVRMGQMWEGEAKNAFQAALSENIAAVREACGRIRLIGAYDGSAAASYEECENSVSGLLAGTSI